MRSAGSGRIGSCACWPAAWNGACAAPGRHRPEVFERENPGFACAAPGRHRGRRGGDGGAPMAPVPRLGAAAVRRRDPGRRPAHPRPRRRGPTHRSRPARESIPAQRRRSAPSRPRHPARRARGPLPQHLPGSGRPLGPGPVRAHRADTDSAPRRTPHRIVPGTGNLRKLKNPNPDNRLSLARTRGVPDWGRAAPGTPASRRHRKTRGTSDWGNEDPGAGMRKQGCQPTIPGDARCGLRWRVQQWDGRNRNATWSGRSPDGPALKRHERDPLRHPRGRSRAGSGRNRAPPRPRPSPGPSATEKATS